MSVSHLITLNDLPAADIRAIVQRAMLLKADPSQALSQRRKTLALLFDKASTRTRLAFEVAMAQLDGTCVFMAREHSQMGRGEPLADAARVMGRIADCIAIRTFAHERLETFAAHCEVPVINALSDSFHPCQLLADMQTFNECRGSIKGRRVVWIGDGNNMCQSYINAAAIFDFELRIACPPGFEPERGLLEANSDRVTLVRDPRSACRDADLVTTDVWASMGQEEEQGRRVAAFAEFTVNDELMALARDEVLFMHCLPAHRGEEVSASVIDGPQSVVWQQAENRMHTQKALLETLLTAG